MLKEDPIQEITKGSHSGRDYSTLSSTVMLSCCRCHCVLLLLLLMVITVCLPGSFPSVKVNLYGAATLPCNHTCSGLVTWTVSHKQRDILAQCDQISCQSKEGFHMSHDQYLKGDLSLTITAVDYTKRAWYTCTCNNKDICDVSLQIEALKSSVKMKPGDSLVLGLPISEPVEVIYNSTDAAAPFSGQICTVHERSLQCKDEYSQRASLMSVVELRGTAPSDSGVYTIQDINNEEVIHTYTVIVEEIQPHPVRGQGVSVPVWVWTLILLVMVLLFVGSVVINVRQWRTNQHLQNRSGVDGTSQL
ncbi:uncharacterized protein LOC143509886 isoform X2 [Brachyhypopomus gauderio]|uniref:uncharacterized protein LOC143509886 isoform X2 n=1 Tax=Brachyhypopomus gauderio TaxID=698409 RepID=UPI004041BA79